MFDQANSTVLFSDVWTKVKAEPYKLNGTSINGSKYPLSDDSFLDFLHLLKCLPSTRTKFETSVSNFIKISEVNLII